MKIGLDDIGEFGLIEMLGNKTISEGLGDDCAILPDGKDDLLVSSDMLIEGTHFLRNAISPYDLGWKTLAVNISDVAAMGGIPEKSFLSIGLPSDLDIKYVDRFFDGYGELASRFGVTLSGGDTTRSQAGIVLNVTILGRCKHGSAVLRSGAVVGDIVCVTGPLGDSGGGLEYVLKGIVPKDNAGKKLLERHHKPIPRVKEGTFLASIGGVTAMMDISDGIASDLPHILESSNTGAVVDLNLIPYSEELSHCAAKLALDPMEKAICGGEDYELLASIAADRFEAVADAYKKEFNASLYKIGTITPGNGIVWKKGNEQVKMKYQIFRHFR